MLQIKNISKQYKTGELVQNALNDVSLNFRDNEFVAILGPSGSGKTTLLNIIGGLDRYDSGDLIINGISTKKYKDRDWDSYRNHTIGFVFQSYNLIPHQNILSNVELALTISGISKSERKKRAKEALEKVGLGDQLHKRPNQMSGGQMQRVAIARALVNDPDILLADEPTGALDSETSIQVMNLLNEVAKDRLVIMVTHNPELAEKYANRVVNLADGKITGDTNPLEVQESEKEPEHKNMGKSSMSFITALALSFNNLRTKKGRTVLTSFAGSIGIIGIALILSISNGVNIYIDNIQRSTMTSYPIKIEEQTIDLSSIMEARQKSGTSITVDTALEQGREVLAVPGRVTDRLSDGCNYLISQGAGVAISVEDVLDRLWSIKGEAKPALSTESVLKNQEKDTDDEMEVNKELTLEEKILEIVDIIPVSTSYIAEELFKKGENLSMPALMTTLMDMTGCGKIAQNGAYYRRIA